jgi:hypothetical protein
MPITYDREKSFVYVIQCETFFKIGVCKGDWGNAPRTRIQNIQTNTPFDIKTIFVFEFDEYNTAHSNEQKLHEMFKKSRVRGEWFELNASQLERIKKAYLLHLILDNGYEIKANWFVEKSRKDYWRTRYQNTNARLKNTLFRLRMQLAKNERINIELKKLKKHNELRQS